MKKILINLILFYSVLFGVGAAAATKQPSFAEAEVEAWYRSYAEMWVNANPDIPKVTDYYAPTFYYLAGDGPLLDTRDTLRASLQQYAEDWKKIGWTGARLLKVDVTMLNASSALINTEWDIHDADGQSIIGCDNAPWTYLASKKNGEWKLTLEIEIECGRGLNLNGNS